MLIFPFVALAQEKYNTLKLLFRYTNIKVGCFAGGSKPGCKLEDIDVLVCTNEKANSLLNYFNREETLDQIGCIVIDEIHGIGDGARGFLLELICSKLLRCEPSPQIVGMSATIPNLEQMGRWLNSAIVYRTDFRPVPLTVTMCLKGKLFEVVDGKQKMVRTVKEHEVLSGINQVLPCEITTNMISMVVETLVQE